MWLEDLHTTNVIIYFTDAVPMSPYVREVAVIAIFILLSCVTLVRNKTLLINEYVHDDAIDILANTETWLKRGGDSAFITELTSSWNILMKLLASPCFKHMELLRARLMGTNVCPLDVYVVYHPPVLTKDLGPFTDFMTELETFFSEITLSVVPAVVVGDFNIHYNDPSKADKLIDLLGTFGVIQHVTTPTHIHGYILELVIRWAVD